MIRQWVGAGFVCFLGLPAVAQVDGIPTPLSAQGNEPAWVLTVNEAGFMLSTQSGLRLSGPAPAVAEVGDQIILTGESLSAVIDQTVCRDTMTGMPYPYRVTVRSGAETFAGCGGVPTALLLGDWTVTDAQGSPVSADATLTFTADAVGGSGGCNRFSGRYQLTSEGLDFSALAATKMACPGDAMLTEQAVFAALDGATRFDVTDGGDLVLFQGDTPVLTAQR